MCCKGDLKKGGVIGGVDLFFIDLEKFRFQFVPVCTTFSVVDNNFGNTCGGELPLDLFYKATQSALFLYSLDSITVLGENVSRNFSLCRRCSFLAFL